MASTRFDFAPPPVSIAGGLAVPIDIQRVEARLGFNPLVADTLDANVDFVTGPVDGFPVFDLRQEIRLAWLDGDALPPERLAHHDLGGGPNAEMRVIERSLSATTEHRLRLVADLGPPQVRTDKNRRPVLLWTDRKRLTFRFGFTDRRAARYLESWIPSNLIFDEFALTLNISVEQTNILHRIITNGEVEDLGFNNWVVRFPDSTVSLDPLLEIMAADRLESTRAMVSLPGSGRSVAVEVWKERGDTTDLDAVLQTATEALPEYESRFGPYPQGERLVIMADANSEGMEYRGGATGDKGSLRHEIAHSWWGRGVRPASQPDSWFDEAWVVYAIDKEDGPRQGFRDTNGKRIAIAPFTPWSRVTVLESYGIGSQLFGEIAAMIGPDRTEGVMRDLFPRQYGKPLTTAALEEHFVRHVPRVETVELFHRVVYGLADPTRPPIFTFPASVSSSSEPVYEALWDSPSLWVRNDNDGGTIHQTPRPGRVNWVFVRVRNDGRDRVTHAVVVFRADPSPLLDPCGPTVTSLVIGASVQFDWLPEEVRVVAVPWDHQVNSSSFTFSAQVLSPGLPRSPCPELLDRDSVAWKTRTDGLAFADSLTPVVVAVGNRYSPCPMPLLLELARSPAAERASVVLTHPVGLPVPPTPPSPDGSENDDSREEPPTEITFAAEPLSSLSLELPPSSVYLSSLVITLPDDVVTREEFRFDLVARRPHDRSLVGGMAIVLIAP